MSSKTLHPFYPLESEQKVDVQATVRRDTSTLFFHFQVSGNLEKLILPTQNNNPTRKDNLWQHTCFEVFFGEVGKPDYWELNLSPSKDWNLYIFDSYRTGMKPVADIKDIKISSKLVAPDLFTLECKLELDSLIKKKIELGFAAVIESIDGHQSYWALSHEKTKPDFHLRKSFLLIV